MNLNSVMITRLVNADSVAKKTKQLRNPIILDIGY